MAVTYGKSATLDNFDMDSTQSVETGRYRDIAVMQVPAQQARKWGDTGFTAQNPNIDDRGNLRLDLRDGSDNQLEGSVRLVVSDADGTQTEFLRDFRTEDATFSDPLELEEIGPWVLENSKLILQFEPDSNATLDKSNSKARVPLRYVVGQGAEEAVKNGQV